MGRNHSEDHLDWEDNIKMHVREVGWESVDWLHVAQDRDQ